MFTGQYGGLALDGDHLDISYRQPETWPSLTPKGSIRSFTFDIGDPDVGPSIQLGLNTPIDDEQLDWKRSIDPVHHHGSDQFRVVSGGAWNLAKRTMTAGSFSFQEAGWVYQEHPEGTTPTWLALLMADRRGSRSTLRFKRDENTIFAAGVEYGQPDTETPYPHPAGNKGLAAIETTAGRCQRGYLYFEPGDIAAGDVITGILGDPEAGPIVHAFKGVAGQKVVPMCSFDTEVVLIVADGTADIGDKTYLEGEIRIQAAQAPFAVAAGEAGTELIMIVADRRANCVPLDGEQITWMRDGKTVLRGLAPLPGGTWLSKAAANTT